jgi:UPF0755 protein
MKKELGPWLRVCGALVCVGLITSGLQLARGGASPAPDFACTDKGVQVNVEIPAGATGSEIAQILFNQGIVKSSTAYFRTAVANPKSEKVAPGGHLLTSNNCAQNALAELLDAKRLTGLINVFEGAWNTEVVEAMVKAGFDRAEVLAALKNVALPTGFTKSEGLLFPAQYSFAKGSTALSAIQAMVDRAALEIEKSGITGAAGKYSSSQLLIIASIIQAEGKTQDFTKISRVIRNRLEKGIPLQMDSTVNYIKKRRGTIFLSTASTLLKSPYNTYRNYGLPPGPIGNPGSDALNATMNPAIGDWIYFITVAPSDTRFTNNFEEFNGWKAIYKKNLRAGLFGSSK